MREIDLKATDVGVMPINTFLCYGDTRSGKTTWAGTFPRPLFLSDVTEKGFESLRDDNWNDEATPRFEENVPPIVWGIETEADFVQCLERAKPLIQSGRIKSIWLDSISFYSDLILNSILMRQTKVDMRKAYGDLGIHLRNVRIQGHALGVNFGWLALARHPEEDDPVGRPLIPGQQSDKFSAGCDFIFHFRVDQPQPSQPANFNIYTKRYPVKDGRHYVAGNRLGGRANLLASPMRGTYATMMESLGYDVDAIRKGLVPMNKIPAVTPVAPKAPPVMAKPAAVAVKPATFVVKGVSNGSSVEKSTVK
jgi:hypothetical protein